MTTRRTFLAAIAAPALRGQDDKGKQIIDSALAALGGRAFLAMRDRIETGRVYSFYREELNGLAVARIYTRYLTRPEPPVPDFIGVRERQSFGKKKEETYVLFNETGAWDVGYRGARPMPDAQKERYKESTLRNTLYILRMRLGEPGLVFEARGSTVIENQPVDLVEIADSKNRIVTVAVHQSTRLPVRQTTTRRDPVTNIPVEEVTLFNKYRDVGGGVQWPFQMERQRDGHKIFEIFSETVTINNDLTDNLFTLSADVKIIDKKKR